MLDVIEGVDRFYLFVLEFFVLLGCLLGCMILIVFVNYFGVSVEIVVVFVVVLKMFV